MALVVTFRLPKRILAAALPAYGSPAEDALSIKQTVRQMIELALARNLALPFTKVPASDPIERINLSLPEESAVQIRSIAKSHGLPESEICQQMAIAALSDVANAPTMTMPIPLGAEPLVDAWGATGKQPRHIQAVAYLNLVDTLTTGSIGMIEAGTGTGKTLAMLLVAANTIRKDRQRIVIATPTIALARQFTKQHNELTLAGIDLPPIRAIFGRREFVSKEELLLLSRHAKYIDHQEAIDRWIALNGEPLPDTLIDAPWTIETLKLIVPNFPVELCALQPNSDPSDPGNLAYQAQFSREIHDDQEIVLCTHAMLAVSLKQQLYSLRNEDELLGFKTEEATFWAAMGQEDNAERRKTLSRQIDDLRQMRSAVAATLSADKGRLPPFRYLLVDEAHQLEANIAAANADYLSLHSLVHLVEEAQRLKAGVTQAMVAEIKAHLGEMKRVAEISSNERISIGQPDRLSSRGTRILQQILATLDVRRPPKKPTSEQKALLWRINAAAYILRSSLLSRVNTRAEIHFSPVRALPQVHCGSRSVDNLLSHLWSSVSAAACVSATLYLPKQDGHSAGLLQGILCIPALRAKEYPPVTAPWLHAPVTFTIEPPAEIDCRPRLRPPTKSDKLSPERFLEAETAWIADLAEKIADLYHTAAGGVMVLMTSYDSLNKLSALLPMRDALVIASSEDRVQDQAAKFMKLSQRGAKPLWLATGAAWTGLDVGGHDPWAQLFGEPLPPQDDNVLTDLIIPRIPYGINKSMTHAHRIARSPAVPWEMLDALFRLKQGVGRLIRREGLPNNRRIHLLDTRIHEQAFRGIKTKIEQIAKPYRPGYSENRVEFD